MTLVAVGDSITNGYGKSAGGEPLRSWVALIADALDMPLVNLAENGAAVAQMIERQLPRLPDHADLAVTMLGANDVIGWGFVGHYLGGGADRVVAALTDVADTVLVAALPAPTRLSTWRADPALRRRIGEANRHLSEVAERHGALWLDLEHAFDGPRRWMLGHDRLHWNTAGHRLAARLALDVLEADGWPAVSVPEPPRASARDRALSWAGQVQLLACNASGRQ